MSDFVAPTRRDCGEFVIRSYSMDDVDALYASVSTTMDHLMEFIPWATENYLPSDTRTSLENLTHRYSTQIDFTLGIWQGDQIVGGTGFHLRGAEVNRGNAEIGMWIHKRVAGKGLGTRVLAEMLDWGFTEWPWQRIEWRCDPRNIASARVAEKCGMELEGTLRSNSPHSDGSRRDTMVFALLRL